VVNLVPKLLPPGNPLYPAPEIILHIGLAAKRDYFAIEQGAQGRGYARHADVDGECFEDANSEQHFPQAKYPSELTTSFDTHDVLARWKANLGYTSIDGTTQDEGCADVRISQDAGNFLCGFIYWNSLAHYFSIKEDERPVVFMHVPDLSGSEDKLREGRDVAVALIKALVESKRKIGVVGRRQEGGGQKGVQTDNNFA
jgi:pyrrolidone-carboxylate peptidase